MGHIQKAIRILSVHEPFKREILHNKKVGRVTSLEKFETLNPLAHGRRLQFGAAGMDGLVNSGAEMGAKYAKEGLSAAGVKGTDRLVNADAAMGANSSVDIGKMGYHTGKNIMSREEEGLASSGVRTTQEVVFDLVEHDVTLDRQKSFIVEVRGHPTR